MPRQTAFPGIWIDSMEIEGKAPPEGGFIVENNARVEEGIMEEAVNRGIMREFEVLQEAAEFSSDTVGQFIRDAESQVGPFLDGYMLTYNLKVRGLPNTGRFDRLSTFTEKAAERSVSTRARAFARVKNPFEPEIYEVSVPSKDEDLSDTGFSVYDVSVTVTK